MRRRELTLGRLLVVVRWGWPAFRVAVTVVWGTRYGVAGCRDRTRRRRVGRVFLAATTFPPKTAEDGLILDAYLTRP